MVIWRGDDSSLYDRTDWERLAEQPDVALKNEILRGLMPPETKSVVDIGCGNGLLVNSLPADWHVVGVDRSESALEGVKRERIVASADQVPLEDGSFDIVVCSEVLEHLPSNILDGALGELQRICKRRILISVPNDEDLMLASTRCDECGMVFNRHGHLRAFNKGKLLSLFPGWRPLAIGECGAETPVVPRVLSRVRAFTDRGSTRNPAGDVCPACAAELRNQASSLFGRTVNRVYAREVDRGPTKLYWLFVALERCR